MLITYGGIRVGQVQGSESAIGQWIAFNIRPHELFPLARLNWPGSLSHAPVLEQTQPPWQPVIIDCLWWPWGASRFARAHVVVGEKNLNLIREQIYAGNSYKALPFIIDDGFYSTPVQTDLWMLPARPLSQAAKLNQGGEGLYLLTLVDERYFWWETSLQYDVTEGTTEWTDIFDAIGTALGVTISVDDIASAYGSPVAAYAAAYRPTPAVFDAIAFAVGQRVVRNLDGTVETQNATTALANQDDQLTKYKARKRRGGTFDLTTITPTDLSGLVPATVEVVYPSGADFETDTTTLATLNLPQYPQPLVGGQPWTKVLHRYEAKNSGLTTQVATDWLLWQLATIDEWFAGTVPWELDGLEDVEWRQVNGEITTHVCRGVYNSQEDLIPVATQDNPFVLLRITGKKTVPVSNTQPAGQHEFYSWELVDDKSTGDVELDPSVTTGGSSISDWPAYETSGYSMVPVDGSAIVRAWKGRGNYYFFVWPEDEVLALIVGNVQESIGGIPTDSDHYYWIECTAGPELGINGFTQVASGRGTDVTHVNYAYEMNRQTDVPRGAMVWLKKGYSPGAADITVEALPPSGNNQIDGFYFVHTLNSGIGSGGSFYLTVYNHDGSQSASIGPIAYPGGMVGSVLQTLLNAAIASSISPAFTVTVSEPGAAGIPGSAADPWAVLYTDGVTHPLLVADPCGLIGQQEWLFAKPNIDTLCKDVELDPQERDRCDYPYLNRYIRTIVIACGLVQTPLPPWTNIGQVGCCGCDAISGSVVCCCPANTLCIYWPEAFFVEMRNGLTLTPNFIADNCEWDYSGTIEGYPVTIKAVWYGCTAGSGKAGTLVVTVTCTGSGLWAVYYGTVFSDASGCWDMTQPMKLINANQQQQCFALGPPPQTGIVTQGPCTSSGSGSPCVLDSLCAYVSTANGDCACAIGSSGTLVPIGNNAYVGNLVLSCPGLPSMFVNATYINDGITWILTVQITGCNGDTGTQTFSGSSFGDCLAGLPQCIEIPGPTLCCGGGTGGGTGTGPDTYWCITSSGPEPPFDGNLACYTGDTICFPQSQLTATGTGFAIGQPVTWDWGGGITCGGTISDGPFAESSCNGGCTGGIIIVPFTPDVQPSTDANIGPGDGLIVCITAGPCDIPSGSGTTRYWCIHVTSSGGGGGSITTDCCPSDPLPSTLLATITSSDPLAGTYTLTWNGSAWVYSGDFGTCSSVTNALVLACGGDLLFNLSGAFLDFTVEHSSLNCNPLSITFPGITSTTCGSTGAATVVVTAVSSGSGSGTAVDLYECIEESLITGTLTVGSSVSGSWGSGTIVGGPYLTPTCDNQCPPTSGTGPIPDPCCGNITLPATLYASLGGALVSWGTVKLISQGDGVTWESDLITNGDGCTAQFKLVCGFSSIYNKNIWTFGANIQDSAGTGTSQCGAAVGEASSCTPVLITFTNNGNCTHFGGVIDCAYAGYFSAIVTE